MSRRGVASTFAAFAALALAGRAPASGPVVVTVDRSAVSTALGHKFVLRTTISNHGSTAARNLIAHLNVLSLREGVYVDPEDWSSRRTRYLAPIPARRSVTVAWKLQAVNAGSIGVYVAVLPRSGVARPPTTGPTVHVSVARRRTINPHGVLPLAVGIPALLGALTLGLRVRRRDSHPSREADPA